MDFNTLPSFDQLQKTIRSVKDRGINVTLAETKGSALALIQTLIPEGASLMTSASVTLQQIGFEALLKSGDHPWKNLKAEILAEKDPARQALMRKQATLADYFLGSVHAIAETGEIVFASATGSQLPAYAYSSSNIIWVAGAQKITPTLKTALERLRTFVVPLEDQRLKQVYGEKAQGIIGKILIFEHESPNLHRNVHLILINEILGF
jgi:L-lactate utilization protein LutC